MKVKDKEGGTVETEGSVARHEGKTSFSEHLWCCNIDSQILADVHLIAIYKALIVILILADAGIVRIVRIADCEKVRPESANSELGEVREEKACHCSYSHVAKVPIELYQKPGEVESKDWKLLWRFGVDSENLNEEHKESDEASPDEETDLHGNSLVLNIRMLQVLVIAEESSLVRSVARASYHVDIEHGDCKDHQRNHF